MTWAERIRATLSGDVAGIDVTAMLAATGVLDALRQQLADRRLSARINHVGEEWRVLAEIGPLAAPLWLGEGLVTLVQGLSEAEAEAHPDRPNTLSAAVHDLAVTALRPIETIVAEASAAAADPTRPSWLTAAVLAGPRGEVAMAPLPVAISPGYVNGLMLAAERLHGAAGMLLADLTTLIESSQPPAWLTAAFQRLKGDLAAAGARLAMLRTRLAALIPDPTRFPVGVHSDALAPIAIDLWAVLNVALVGGQMLSDPRLMPGAHNPAAAGRSAPPEASVRSRPSAPAPEVSAPRSPVAPAQPPTPPPQVAPPRPPVRVERAYDLPDIQTVPVPVDHTRRPPANPGASPPRPAERPATALPDIGSPLPRPAERPATGLPDVGSPSSRPAEQPSPALPDIGGPSKAAGTPAKKAAHPLPKIDAHSEHEEQAVHELPQIGPG